MKFKIAIVLWTLLLGYAGYTESNYCIPAICIEKSEDVYTFVDESGNGWEWADKNSFSIGKEYTLIINDNHTPHILTDDWILKIKG